MTYETIRVDIADGVATITLTRPAVHNAMNDVMRRELLEVFTGLTTDEAVRVVVVTGAASARSPRARTSGASSNRKIRWRIASTGGGSSSAR
jgi:1,4-dihydroxy-2-naphthoyl-CoA synthase